ncbi:MbnP family protein [Spirosoma agri]|uniref:Copper-binding protein MbnP-like domain-containing protein n=1 Tax=Spirosoma agri TaxID=1987381 RepID=A0A6M0IFC2_9BACT|nr:MbnP family protein [Spirosoma agri]NEU66864.1 hypothetical protein [Spirosoma agri]
MKNSIKLLVASVLFIGLAITACDTTNPYVPPDPFGSISLTLDNVAGDQDLKLNTNTYQNAVGESFIPTKFNYFVSNIQLKKQDGSTYTLPQANSYFLVQEEKPESQSLTLASIPSGNYTAITFVVGVDSVRSLADISLRTGVLDPALNDGMYWEWNSGYIFMKLEGTSALAPATQNNTFFYHIGGFGGGYNGKKTINNLRKITIPFNGDVVNVDPSVKPQVRLKADLLKVFNGSTRLSIAQNSSVMFDAYSTNIANNYANMFSYDGMKTNQ